jgi:hypothetical protein
MAALADAETAPGGLVEAAAVLRVGELRDQGQRPVPGPLPQVAVQRVRVDELDVRQAGPDRVAVSVGDALQAGVDLGPAAARGDDRGQVLLGRRPDPQAQPVVGEDVELVDVVRGARARPVQRGQHRVRAAGVVPDHPAQRGVVVRGRVGPERQPVRLGRVLELVADHARLHPRLTAPRVQLHDGVHVPREVEDDGLVDSLARQAGTAAAAQHRGSVLPAACEGRLHVRGVSGQPYLHRDTIFFPIAGL